MHRRRAAAALLSQVLYASSNLATSLGVAWKFGTAAAGDSALVVGTTMTAITAARALALEPLSATARGVVNRTPEGVFSVGGLIAGLAVMAPLALMGAVSGLTLVSIGAVASPALAYAEGVRYGLLRAGRIEWVAAIDGFWLVSTVVTLVLFSSWRPVVIVWLAAPVVGAIFAQASLASDYSNVLSRIRGCRNVATWTSLEGLSFASQEQIYRLALGAVGSTQLGSFRVAQALASPTSLVSGGMHIFDLSTRDQSSRPGGPYIAMFIAVATAAGLGSIGGAVLLLETGLTESAASTISVAAIAIAGALYATAVPFRNFARAVGYARVGALAQLANLGVLVGVWRYYGLGEPVLASSMVALFGLSYLISIVAGVRRRGR